MTEFYNSDAFQNYLSDRQKNIRIVDDVLWVNAIPLPITIVDDIFGLGDTLFTIYAESLLSAFILAQYDLTIGIADTRVFPTMPDPGVLESNKPHLLGVFAAIQDAAEFKAFESALFRALGTEVRLLTDDAFLKALSHKGKKYSRLYYPESVSKYFETHIPKIKTVLTKKNGDMFGNIVADTLGIYRNGFSDALSLIFNRFLDFKIDEFGGASAVVSNYGKVSTVESSNALGSIEFGRTGSGVLWEPRLDENGDIISVVNQSHAAIGPASDIDYEDLFVRFLSAFSEVEMSTASDEELKKLEQLRMNISRIMRA